MPAVHQDGMAEKKEAVTAQLKEGDNPSWMWWHVPIIPKLSKLRQENHESRLTWAT